MKIKLLILFALCRLSVFSQEKCPDFLFANHLLALHDYRLALEVLNKSDSLCNSSDSTNFLKAVCYYNMNEHNRSTDCFMKVKPDSKLFNASLFYSADNYIYLDKFDQAAFLLDGFNTSDSKLSELAEFEKAGVSLLNRDLAAFEKYRTVFTGTFIEFSEEEKNLADCFSRMLKFRYKSKFVAGFFSALVPGAGKVYSGKWGEGLSAFFIVGTLGLVTAENFIKRGIDHPKTIIAGGLFTVFYIGNIWGSVLSIERYRNDFYESQDHIIRASLHIPLGRIFR